MRAIWRMLGRPATLEWMRAMVEPLEALAG
jgi:hypothetical protein